MSNDFPRYLIQKGNRSFFMTLSEAASTLNCGLVPSEIGDLVLEADFSVRPLIKDDHNRLVDAADEVSANK